MQYKNYQETDYSNVSIFKLWKLAGPCGILLLSKPIITLLFSRNRSAEEYASIDTSALIFIVYSIICFIYAYKELRSKDSILGQYFIKKSPIVLFILYTIWGLVSMIWSVNVPLTGFRAFECFAYLFMLVAIFNRLFKFNNVDIIFRWSILYAFIDITFSIIRYAAIDFNLSLILRSSQYLSTTFFFIALYAKQKKWYNYFIIFFALVSMSTVAYIGMTLGAIGVLWKKGHSKVIALFIFFILSIATLAIGPKKMLKETLFFDKEEISIHETSGRDFLLEASIECFKQYPMGLGFYSGEPYWFYKQNVPAISTHNAILSAAIAMGYIGVILMILYFIGMAKIVFSRYIDKRYKSILFGIFCVAFLHCIGNPSIGTRVYGAWLPVMYVFTLICAFYIKGKYFTNK